MTRAGKTLKNFICHNSAPQLPLGQTTRDFLQVRHTCPSRGPATGKSMSLGHGASWEPAWHELQAEKWGIPSDLPCFPSRFCTFVPYASHYFLPADLTIPSTCHLLLHQSSLSNHPGTNSSTTSSRPMGRLPSIFFSLSSLWKTTLPRGHHAQWWRPLECSALGVSWSPLSLGHTVT